MAKAPERKPATVLIAELRNVTRLSEALPPERVLALANEFFALCARVVIAEGGRVLSVHNDSLLAAFLDDEPKNCNKNAVKAAKGIRGAFGSVGERWQKEYGLPAAVSVGVHVGEVVFGMAGPLGAQQFIAFGDCVSIADRLVHRARAGEVVISFEVIGRSAAPLRNRWAWRSCRRSSSASARRCRSTDWCSRRGWTSPTPRAT